MTMMLSSAEQQLWCAVIHRALQDATDNVGAISSAAERAKLREDARGWFAANDRDFRQACEAAGLDPDVVRNHVVALIGFTSQSSAG